MTNTGFKGVNRQTRKGKDKTYTYIIAYFASKHLGLFPDTEKGLRDAARAYDKALMAATLNQCNFKDRIRVDFY